jgi:hypothetical protein
LTLHAIAQSIIEKQKAKLEAVNIKNPEVFSLATADGANKIVDAWVKSAGIDKYTSPGRAPVELFDIVAGQKCG